MRKYNDIAWWQFSIQCRLVELEQVETALLQAGALSISLTDAGDEPLYEPLPGSNPVWQQSIVTGLFASHHHPEQLYQNLSQCLPIQLLNSLRQNWLEDRDWVQAYRDHYVPISCGNKLWVVPSWHQPPDPSALNIMLDPGLAFGTGAHPTTALCLAWLSDHSLQGQTVLDYGCGSGILAIAACKLGAKRVLGVDIDPQALVASRQNARRNHILDKQFSLSLSEQSGSTQVDLLMANILSGPLIELVGTFAGRVKIGGTIVLSGILNQQVDDIMLAYQPFFELTTVVAKADWVRVTGTRKFV